MKAFITPIVATLLTLGAVYWWGGFGALILAIILSALEIVLSFDNAVVNAKVLERMDAKWQQRFLTWGIIIAVFGTRFIFPLFIVAVAASISPISAALLAITDPETYGSLIEGTAAAISSFGGAFLLMVALKYFFDTAKQVHWIHLVESRLSRWGRIEAIEIGLALTAVLAISFIVPEEKATILASGGIGILLFIFINGAAETLRTSVKDVARGAAFLFVYLNILDASFSLDGVIGAFALTSEVPIIVAGLGIGAYFVRTLTVYLVRARTLETLVYLEHGAHWAVFVLAAFMFLDLVVHIPGIVVGLLGLSLIGLAYLSSARRLRVAQNV